MGYLYSTFRFGFLYNQATMEEEEARVVEENGEEERERYLCSLPHTEEESAAWRCSWAWANFLRELSA